MNNSFLTLGFLVFSAPALIAMGHTGNTIFTRYFRQSQCTTERTTDGRDYITGTGHCGKQLVYDITLQSWWKNYGSPEQPNWQKERPMSPIQTPSSPERSFRPIAHRDGSDGRGPRNPRNTSLLRNPIIRVAILVGGVWGIKKIWNYWSTSTQRKIQQLIADAQKLLQEVTPAYAALFEADDAVFMQALENYEKLDTTTNNCIARIQAILKALELLSKKLTVKDAPLQAETDTTTQALVALENRLAAVRTRLHTLTNQPHLVQQEA